MTKWTAKDMAYRPGGLSQSEQEPKADVCCQDFENCVRSCTPRGQWIAHVRCGCGDQIMANDGAECGNCVAARNAVKPDLAQVGEVGVWGEQQLPLKARHAAQEALNALMRWQEICLAKNRSTKELTIPTKAIHALTEILEVKGREQ